MGYRNLDVEAFDHRRSPSGERFRVRINDSPAGQVVGRAAPRVELPAEVRELAKRADGGGITSDQIRHLGELLGKVLLPSGPVRDCFEASRRTVSGTDRLRVRLQLGTCELADLPWEYTVVPRPDGAGNVDDESGFLALDRRLAVVRHEWADRADEPLTPVGDGPLRIVALLASPVDPAYPPLALDVERAAIEGALKRLRTTVSCEFVEHATIDEVVDALDTPTHLLHFAGHGVFQEALGVRFDSVDGRGSLVLEDGDSRPELFAGAKLALAASAVGIRLAVLGACESGRRDAANPWSGVVAALVHTAGLPAVVGMQFRIGDAAAVRFSRKLYELLADGFPIEEAVTAGRLAIALTATSPREWGVPVLYLRAGEGTLFPAAGVTTSEGLLDRARARTTSLLREWRADGVGRWLPATFVERPGAEEAFGSFMASDARALLVTAPSGYGKTSELCHRADELMKDGHGVLLLDAASWTTADVATNIAASLGMGAGIPAELAAVVSPTAGRQMIVMIDAVNEAVPTADEGPSDVIASLDELAGNLPERWRLVAACSTAAWDRTVRTCAARGRKSPLTASRWHRAGGATPGLVLPAFDAEQAREAYAKYQERFRLVGSWDELPDEARAELSVPLVLRLAAEASRGGRIPDTGTGLGLLRRQWDGFTAAEQQIAQSLASALLACREARLPAGARGRPARAFRGAITQDPPAYHALLARGVITETYDSSLLADRVAFTHTRFGAYAAARATLEKAGEAVAAAARDLVDRADRSPLAWDAARLLLAVAPGDAAIIELAGDADAEVRQAVADALGERFSDRPAATTALLRKLLGADATIDGERRRGCAIKAVLGLGTSARELLTWSMSHRSAELRRAVGAVLALRWEHEAAFTDAVLLQLSDAVRFRAPRQSRRVLEAMAEVSIPLYIRHCDDATVTEQTAGLWKRVLRSRLKLHLLVPKMLDPVLVPVVSSVFARRIGETALLADVQPATVFFSRPPEERDRFLRVVPLVEPSAPIEDAIGDIGALLDSDVALFGILGALVLAIHSQANPERTRPIFDDLSATLSPAGRLWALASFSVLASEPQVARLWQPRVDALTNSLAADEPAAFYGERESIPASLGLTAVPAGLVASHRGRPSSTLTRIAKELQRSGRTERASRLWASLGVLGIYRPDAVLTLAWSVLPTKRGPDDAMAMAEGLGAIRVVRPDLVDRFLTEIGASQTVRRKVEAACDPDAVRRVTYALGLFNNGVYQALHYRLMREQLLVGGLSALGRAGSLAEFVKAYTPVPIRMVREAKFDLLGWTR